VDDVPPDAEIRMAGSWGGGDYNESGDSEVIYREGQLLGGLTAGPDGEPTIDIHGGDTIAPSSEGEAKDGRAPAGRARPSVALAGRMPSSLLG
jgi:hypothetical protein